jgi:hypothetical protein
LIRSGGTEQRNETQFLRTDNLIDHRPYVPGDDPRRINWKLYGHAGDLFVREGEPEPPPHSQLVILVDTQADDALYAAEPGRRGVDLLCENALALALEYTDRGMEVSLGYTGGEGLHGGGAGELAAALAYPAARSLSAAGDLPALGDARGVLVLALPRTWGSATALDRFLKKKGAAMPMDLLFLYTGDEGGRGNSLEESAETGVRLYGSGGVHARSVRL